MKLVFAAASASILATSALATGPVVSYEAPVAAYVAPISAYNWTGAYAGLGIGAVRQSDTALNGPAFVLTPSRGGQISGLLGYNFQGAGQLVFGGEVMIAGGSVNGSGACAAPTFACASSMGTTAALRLRAGIAQDRTLFFMTAGAARAVIGHSTELQPVPGLTAASDSRSATTLGIGVEQAMTNGWNLRGEIEGYRFDGGTYILDGGNDYSASRGTATAVRVTLVRRF